MFEKPGVSHRLPQASEVSHSGPGEPIDTWANLNGGIRSMPFHIVNQETQRLSDIAYPITEAGASGAPLTRQGPHPWLAPGDGAVRHLHYGRIILDASGSLEFSTGERETGLICLRGARHRRRAVAKLRADPLRCDLYVPRDAHGESPPAPKAAIWPRSPRRSPGLSGAIRSVPDVRQDPTLHFTAGGESTTRDLNIVIGKNVEAGRILAGVTFSEPGNWTSWPPHEHGATLEEAYLYIDMPEPAWGIQLVYTNPQEPELVVVVREGDCVVMPGGLPSERGGARRLHRLSVDDGGAPRSRPTASSAWSTCSPNMPQPASGLEASQRRTSQDGAASWQVRPRPLCASLAAGALRGATRAPRASK